MKILHIAYCTVLRNFRDKKSISLTLILPILVILILGTALSSADSPRTLDKISVAYVNEDKGSISKEFDAFLNIDDIKDLIDVKQVKTYEEGIKLINEEKVQTLICIKNAFIEVYESQSKGLHVSVVKSIVESFTNRVNTVEAIHKMDANLSNQKFIGDKNIMDMPITTKGNIPGIIDYYAVTMLAMMLMYGTLNGSYAMAEDKLENTYIRIKSSPAKAYINYLGKTLGTIATLLLAAIILIVFTKYAYGVNWGPNIPMILFLSSLFSVFVTGLGIMTYAITNDTKKSDALLNILTVFFTFVSGGYAKINFDGGLLDKLVTFVPNKMFQTAMFNTIYDGSMSQTQACVIGLIVATMIVFFIAAGFGRRVID